MTDLNKLKDKAAGDVYCPLLSQSMNKPPCREFYYPANPEQPGADCSPRTEHSKTFDPHKGEIGYEPHQECGTDQECREDELEILRDELKRVNADHAYKYAKVQARLVKMSLGASPAAEVARLEMANDHLAAEVARLKVDNEQVTALREMACSQREVMSDQLDEMIEAHGEQGFGFEEASDDSPFNMHLDRCADLADYLKVRDKQGWNRATYNAIARTLTPEQLKQIPLPTPEELRAEACADQAMTRMDDQIVELKRMRNLQGVEIGRLHAEVERLKQTPDEASERYSARDLLNVMVNEKAAVAAMTDLQDKVKDLQKELDQRQDAWESLNDLMTSRLSDLRRACDERDVLREKVAEQAKVIADLETVALADVRGVCAERNALQDCLKKIVAVFWDLQWDDNDQRRPEEVSQAGELTDTIIARIASQNEFDSGLCKQIAELAKLLGVEGVHSEYGKIFAGCIEAVSVVQRRLNQIVSDRFADIQALHQKTFTPHSGSLNASEEGGTHD